MADQYEIIALNGVRSFTTQYGECFANKVTVAGPNGEEDAEITTKKQGVLKLGDSFEADRQEGKYGLKLKRVYNQDRPRTPPGSSSTVSGKPARAKPPYSAVLAAYRQFLADTGEKTHATTLLLSWMRGDFEFTPADDPDGPPNF